jgi:hypothetical protein
MKTMLLSLFAVCLIFFNATAQNDSDNTRLIDDTLITSSGYRVVIGQDVKLGTGTLPYGDFKYIGFSQTSFMGSNNPRQQTVGKNWSGHLFKVKRFRVDGNKKRGYTYRLILGGGNIVNYECDIERAIAAGEIIVPDEFKPKSNIVVEVKSKISIADELGKLKKLLDEGVLTQAEYDLEKKKLLEQKQ